MTTLSPKNNGKIPIDRKDIRKLANTKLVFLLTSSMPTKASDIRKTLLPNIPPTCTCTVLTRLLHLDANCDNPASVFSATPRFNVTPELDPIIALLVKSAMTDKMITIMAIVITFLPKDFKKSEETRKIVKTRANTV